MPQWGCEEMKKKCEGTAESNKLRTEPGNTRGPEVGEEALQGKYKRKE